ncbi:MAG: DUF6781 family protein [Pseudomonadota bacterium]|jgi:hypothetical protein
MAENNTSKLSAEEIKSAAVESVQQETDIKAKVRDLTLRAIQSRKLDSAGIKEVVRAVTEGVSIGAEKRGGEVRAALSQAISGLDEALQKSAQATHLALQQLASQSKDFTEHDLKQALDNLKKMEEDFLSTVSQVADAAGTKVKQELNELVAHARRTGTDTGTSVAATVNELGNRLSATLAGGKAAGQEAAHAFSSRLAALASGILAGMADALREKSEKK